MSKFSKTRSFLAAAVIGAGLIANGSLANAAPIEGAGEVILRPFHDLDGDGTYSEGDRYVIGAAVRVQPDETLEDPDGEGPIQVLGGLQVFHRFGGFDEAGEPEWSMEPPDGPWGVRSNGAPGDYTITWALPDGCEATALPDGFAASDTPITGGIANAPINANTVGSGEITVVAGETIDASIPVSCEATTLAGVVFNDLDGDGELNGDEQGIGGATVTLDGFIADPWNPGDPEEGQFITGAPLTLDGVTEDAGVYLIENIAAGEYRLSVSVPDNCALADGWEQDLVMDFSYGDQAELDIPVTCTEPVEPPVTTTTTAPTEPTTTTTAPPGTTQPPVTTDPGTSGGGVRVDTGEGSGLSSAAVVSGVGGLAVLATAFGAAIMLRRRHLTL